MGKVRRVIPPGMKWCPKCRHMHPIEDFSSGYCGPGGCNCHRIYHTEWTRRTRKEMTEAMVKETIEQYGGKCRRCGATNPEVLVVVPRGGKGVRAQMYFLRSRGYPPGYYLLCRNCEVLEAKEHKPDTEPV